VQATVAVVRYAALGSDRLGVCSTFLGERLAPGTTLPVYIHSNPDFRWVWAACFGNCLNAGSCWSCTKHVGEAAAGCIQLLVRTFL
jgi:hypothetical protein